MKKPIINERKKPKSWLEEEIEQRKTIRKHENMKTLCMKTQETQAGEISINERKAAMAKSIETGGMAA